MKKILGVLFIGLLSAGVAGAGGMGTALSPPGNANNISFEHSIYFYTESCEVKDEYKSLLLAYAQQFRDNTNAKVILEGNADELDSPATGTAPCQQRA